MARDDPKINSDKFTWKPDDLIIYDEIDGKLVCVSPPWLRGLSTEQVKALSPRDIYELRKGGSID